MLQNDIINIWSRVQLTEVVWVVDRVAEEAEQVPGGHVVVVVHKHVEPGPKVVNCSGNPSGSAVACPVTSPSNCVSSFPPFFLLF